MLSNLQKFETDILFSMKMQGWDGDESIKKSQWQFHGALFYSIIVITTIGKVILFIQKKTLIHNL